MLNAMLANTDDIKIVAKLRKDEKVSFGVMQVCKMRRFLYDVVNCCSQNKL